MEYRISALVHIDIFANDELFIIYLLPFSFKNSSNFSLKFCFSESIKNSNPYKLKSKLEWWQETLLGKFRRLKRNYLHVENNKSTSYEFFLR